MKKEFKETFSRIYKGCELYAIQLNGFTHTIYYKDANKKKHVAVYSGCAPEQYEAETEYSDGVFRSMNTDKSKMLFLRHGHHQYQHNAKELVFKPATNW